MRFPGHLRVRAVVARVSLCLSSTLCAAVRPGSQRLASNNLRPRPVFAYRASCRIRDVARGWGEQLLCGVEAEYMGDMKRFLEDECGAELVEWAVVTVIVLLATLGVVNVIMDEGLPHYFDAIMENLGFHRVWE